MEHCTAYVENNAVRQTFGVDIVHFLLNLYVYIVINRRYFGELSYLNDLPVGMWTWIDTQMY